jgi:hypothetical protein
MSLQSRRRRLDDVAGGQNDEALLRDSLLETVNASVKAARKRSEEERARLLAEAAKVMEEANATKAEVEKKSREVEESRVALEEEKAAMEKAHTFQKSKINLDIGGHNFTTSRQTLTSVPDTYFASLFSGRFELTPDDDDERYFIDRDGRHFHHILNFLRDPMSFKLSSDVTEGQRGELEVEAKFYGLFDYMMPGPYLAQERIGQSLVQAACRSGKERDIQTAMAQVRVLVFEMGSTTPFLNDKFQDLRFVITDRVVNGSPVWAAVGGEEFMFRCSCTGRMTIGNASKCAEGLDSSDVYNLKESKDVVAPTELPSDEWVSGIDATLESQFASAERLANAYGLFAWAPVPHMRITAVHGLNDDDPTMAAALRQLAALA